MVERVVKMIRRLIAPTEFTPEAIADTLGGTLPVRSRGEYRVDYEVTGELLPPNSCACGSMFFLCDIGISEMITRHATSPSALRLRFVSGCCYLGDWTRVRAQSIADTVDALRRQS